MPDVTVAASPAGFMRAERIVAIGIAATWRQGGKADEAHRDLSRRLRDATEPRRRPA